MTVFKDISNNEYVADTEIKLTEGVNGEKSLTGTIYFGNDVKKNLAKGWTMVFNDEEYAIVTFRHNDTDNTVSFSAVQMFFYTLSVKVFHEKWNGSHPLNEYLNAIFKDTGYSYNNETSAAAFEKENWGLKDKLSLFNDIINQISAEFEVQGTTVYIKDKIGSDLSTVVRQGFNLSTAEIETDNSSFATYGVGYGVHDDADDQNSPRLSVEYYSPLYDMYKEKFGAIEAKPVDDERYKVSDNLLAAVKNKVDNSWSLSITVSLLDLQNAGYPYAMASAGDSITIVDESLNFEDEVRIIKVVSSYNINGERISVDVTCGDLTMAQTQKTSSSVATSTITDIINGNSTLPDAWFSEQMQLATNSILAARTELKFTDQGIIAIDKSDHNKMVILNSAGIGVSTDGGQTFRTAITAESIDGQNINIKNINANNITTGTLKGTNLSMNLNTGEVLFQKGSIKSTNGNLNIDIDSGKMGVVNSAGNGFRFEDGKLYLASHSWIDASQSKPDYGYIAFKNNFLSNIEGMQIAGADGIAVTTGDYDTFSFGIQYRPKSGAALSLHENTAFLNARDHTRIEGGSMYTEAYPWTHRSRATVVVGGANGGVNHSAPTDKYGNYYLQEPVDVGADIFAKGHDITLQGGHDTSTNSQSKAHQYADLNLANDGKGFISSAAIFKRTYSNSPNVYITGYGTLGRSTSASKYKLDISDVNNLTEKAQVFLAVKPKQWFDKQETQDFADKLTGNDRIQESPTVNPHAGFIAEDLAAAGLNEFISYGADGSLEGIQYDRLPILHHELLRQAYNKIDYLMTQLNIMDKKISKLEGAN